jgi:hypothetical protein
MAGRDATAGIEWLMKKVPSAGPRGIPREKTVPLARKAEEADWRDAQPPKDTFKDGCDQALDVSYVSVICKQK